MEDKFKCNKCDKKFTTAQGLSMHKRWNHSRAGRAKMLAAARENAVKARSTQRKKPVVQANIESGLLRKPTRRYQRRKYVRKPSAPTGTATAAWSTINADVVVCPRCACNIQAVRIAMNLTPEQLGL